MDSLPCCALQFKWKNQGASEDEASVTHPAGTKYEVFPAEKKILACYFFRISRRIKVGIIRQVILV